jgi:hypothetical protein
VFLIIALGTASLSLGRAVAHQDRHWLELDGRDWTAMDAREQAAWMRGFLAGRAAGQLPDTVTLDTLAAARELARLRQTGGLEFGYAVPLYTNRLNDFYHWDNHQLLPLWRGMHDVNAELQRGGGR